MSLSCCYVKFCYFFWESMHQAGWQKFCEGTKGLRRKVWTWTKILSPNMRYFVAILRFVTIYTLFGNLWTKMTFFGLKTVFLGQKVHYYMVYIAYFTELNLQICDYSQKRRICRENCKYALGKNFHGHFCSPRNERLPSSATLAKGTAASRVEWFLHKS